MKRILNFVVLLSFMSAIFSGCSLEENEQVNANQEPFTEQEEVLKQYNDIVKEFNKVTTKDLELLEQEKESFFVYTGRSSCPYCQIFAPKLYEASSLKENNGVIINYLNSDNGSDTGLHSYLSNHNIDYVPNLNYFKDGTLVETLQISNDSTIEQISDFIASNEK